MFSVTLVVVLAATLQAGQNCPLDPDTQLPDVLRIKPVVFLTETTVNVTSTGTRPNGVVQVAQGNDFIIELWAQQSLSPFTCSTDGTPCDPDNLQSCGMQPELCTASDALGLECVYADVEFEFAGMALSCNSLDGGTGPGASAFTTSGSGSCTTSGSGDPEVDEGGACTADMALGIFPDWVKIRTVRMTANTLGGPFIARARPATTAVTLMACAGAVPTTRIAYETWPVIVVPPCASDAECSDGDACTGIETCQNNTCVPGEPVDCPLQQLCDPSSGACLDCLADTDCSDGLVCTEDVCTNGACSNPDVVCPSDGDGCTVGVCLEPTGCEDQEVVCPPGLTCDTDGIEGDFECVPPCSVSSCLLPPIFSVSCENPDEPGNIGINLALTPTSRVNVQDGDVLQFELRLTRNSTTTTAQGVEAVLEWDSDVLRILDVTGATPCSSSADCPAGCACSDGFCSSDGEPCVENWDLVYFPDDCDGGLCLNAGAPGQLVNDGDALLSAQAPIVAGPGGQFFFVPVSIPGGDEGVLVGSVRFEVDPGIDVPIDGEVRLPEFKLVGDEDSVCSSVIWGGSQFECFITGAACNPTTNPCALPDICVTTNKASGCNVLACTPPPASVLGACELNCVDQNDNGINDGTNGDDLDSCVWQDCTLGDCAIVPRKFADMGGPFGACQIDGTADGNDRFQALNCFSDQNPNLVPGIGYQCEPNPPQALNVDAGGPFGACVPDGVCDGNDAFAALNAFAGQSSCSCPLDGQPAPWFDTPTETRLAALSLQSHRKHVRPGDHVSVDVLLASPLEDLRGYQLHLQASGGKRGRLELVDIAVRADKRAAFRSEEPWIAFNTSSGQMLAGLDADGIAVPQRAYLATFTYRASDDAAGEFAVELLHDAADRTQRTFLFPTPADGRINIDQASPAIITVQSGRWRWPAPVKP